MLYFLFFIDRLDSTVAVESQNLDIEEAGVKLRLTIIDTPGFSDSLHGEDRLVKVLSYKNVCKKCTKRM